MTVQELQNRRDALEQQLSELVDEFEVSTNVEISEILLERQSGKAQVTLEITI